MTLPVYVTVVDCWTPRYVAVIVYVPVGSVAVNVLMLVAVHLPSAAGVAVVYAQVVPSGLLISTVTCCPGSTLLTVPVMVTVSPRL